MANTPFRRHKTWVHEGGIATPLVVHWPKGIAARGELRHDPGHVIDIVPTILELVGTAPLASSGEAPAPARPGRAWCPLSPAMERVNHDELWWQHEGNRAIRVGDWKLVAAGEDGPWELYDLAADRTEMHDLAKEQPDRVRDLARRWAARRDEFAAQAQADF